jgi:hypothetical protein
MLSVPMHQGECGDAMWGWGYCRMKSWKCTSRCEQYVGIVLKERGERKGERVRDRGKWCTPYVDVPEESKARVSCCLVELVRAILGRC